MGKKPIFKGLLRGIAKSSILDKCFVFKVDKTEQNLPEDLPDEFVVYIDSSSAISKRDFRGFSVLSKKALTIFVRTGDKIILKGEIFQDFEGEEKYEYIRMVAHHFYNETLKCGF